MNNVIDHPNRATGFVKAVTHKIEADRRVGIVLMRSAVEDLKRLGNEPGMDFVWELVRKYQRVLFELEALDPSDPPSLEKVQALRGQVQSLRLHIRASNTSPRKRIERIERDLPQTVQILPSYQ